MCEPFMCTFVAAEGFGTQLNAVQKVQYDRLQQVLHTWCPIILDRSAVVSYAYRPDNKYGTPCSYNSVNQLIYLLTKP